LFVLLETGLGSGDDIFALTANQLIDPWFEYKPWYQSPLVEAVIGKSLLKNRRREAASPYR
jgi:hypothetical protein